jgi:hypothetical protein
MLLYVIENVVLCDLAGLNVLTPTRLSIRRVLLTITRVRKDYGPDPNAKFTETRDTPILRDVNDYELCVLKCVIDGGGKSLPLSLQIVREDLLSNLNSLYSDGQCCFLEFYDECCWICSESPSQYSVGSREFGSCDTNPSSCDTQPARNALLLHVHLQPLVYSCEYGSSDRIRSGSGQSSDPIMRDKVDTRS